MLRYFPPEAREKLGHRYVGPYLVVGKLNDVNYKIQSDPQSRVIVIVVHVDSLKAYEAEDGEAPRTSWLAIRMADQEVGVQTEISTLDQGVQYELPSDEGHASVTDTSASTDDTANAADTSGTHNSDISTIPEQSSGGLSQNRRNQRKCRPTRRFIEFSI